MLLRKKSVAAGFDINYTIPNYGKGIFARIIWMKAPWIENIILPSNRSPKIMLNRDIRSGLKWSGAKWKITIDKHDFSIL